MMIGATQPAYRTFEATSTAVAKGSDSGFSAADPASASVALYYSPKLRFDTEANVAVLEYRDVLTGKMERSIPTKAQLEAYEKAAKIAREEEADKRLQDLLGLAQEEAALAAGGESAAMGTDPLAIAGAGDMTASGPSFTRPAAAGTLSPGAPPASSAFSAAAFSVTSMASAVSSGTVGMASVSTASTGSPGDAPTGTGRDGVTA
ncbi:hypothetical protein [Oleisolibacter albus]|uniref:hypothetical protein n=1 Tax=Oleisolibacter albus TaxID=2171757 RepID=UPI000DF36DDF|nr:hypothetical protein [Oleisolibacter albus]